MIFGGKIKAALRLLANFEDSGGSVLLLNAMIDGEESVQDVLKRKHPTEETPQPDMLLASENPADAQVHPVLFEIENRWGSHSFFSLVNSWRSWTICSRY